MPKRNPEERPEADWAVLERLAALRLPEAEAAGLRQDLERILESVDVLAAACLDDVPPTWRLEPDDAAAREDVPAPDAGGGPGDVTLPSPRWRGETP